MLVSDNTSGVHESILKALIDANAGFAASYGDDTLSAAAAACFAGLLGANVKACLVFNGTAANVLALKAMTRSFHAIICSSGSHLWVDETGAPENFLGCKLLTVPDHNGKIRIADIKPLLADTGSRHRSQPKVISLTQCTERGTVYSLAELETIYRFAKQNGLLVHMDGARIHNALARLGCDCKTMLAGVDALSFGGTKNGMMFGEAVILLNPALQDDFTFIHKHAMQLASKMRFLAAQYCAYFHDGLWLKNAAHANAMATYLASGLAALPGIRITAPVEANMVFAELPRDWLENLQTRDQFLLWQDRGDRPEIRLVTSFNTEKSGLDHFINSIAAVAVQNRKYPKFPNSTALRHTTEVTQPKITGSS